MRIMNDLIFRGTAIDALTDTNLRRNVDNMYDGDMNRTRRAAHRIIAQLPAIDAIPVEWLRSQMHNNPNDIESAYDDICIGELIKKWQKEQEAR